jgi:two-component system, NarL family, sensor histidine kinase DevS
MHSVDSHETHLHHLADGARLICEGDWAAVGLLDLAARALRVRRWIGSPRPVAAALPGEPSAASRAILARGLLEGRAYCSRYPGGPFASRDPLLAGTLTSLAVPIRVDGRLEGLLCVGRRSAGPFTGRDQSLLQWLAEQAAVIIAHSRLREEAEQRRRQAEELAMLGRIGSPPLDRRDAAQRIVDGMRRLLGAPACVLYGGSFPADPADRPLAASGTSCDRIPAHPPGVGAVGLARGGGCTVTTSDLLTDPRFRLTPALREYVEETDYGAVLAVPLLAGRQSIGVLAARGRTHRAWTTEETRLARVYAEQATIAFERARRPGGLDAGSLDRRAGRRLANELHDLLSQLAFSAGLKLDWSLRHVRAGSPLRPKLEEVRREIGLMMARIRQLIGHLGPAGPGEAALPQRLRLLADEFRELTGIAAELTLDGDPNRLSAAVGEGLYQTLQEALVNIAKHARAARAAIRLEIGAGRIVLAVSDDGAGLPAGVLEAGGAAAPGHQGLRQMRERIEALGGRLELLGNPGGGVQVRAVLPLA